MKALKVKITVIALLIAILSVPAPGTLAYYTVTGVAQNVITAGSLEVELHEKMDNGDDFPEKGVPIMPGDTVSKIVTVENTGVHPVWVRINLETVVNKPELSADGCLKLDLNEKEWIYSDGYYYYYQSLEPEETTEPLFTKVEVDGYALDNSYLGSKFTLKVNLEAVQSENNGESALEALDWSVPAEEVIE